jgi:glycosyltransferase involved in cell wall biosynthesis
MKIVDLAIIIPTLNEEGYIGKLLDSIAAQTVHPKELVVVDAFSKDKTIEEISARRIQLPQLRWYQIKKYTISRQRNFGTQKTSSPNILFLDADMELKRLDTLELYMQQVNEHHPDIAIAENLPNTKHLRSWIYLIGENNFLRMIKSVWPAGTSRNFYVTRKIFDKVGGFDGEVAVGEDIELIQRIVRCGGKFLIFRKPKMYTSTRRFEKDGLGNHLMKMVKSFFYVQKNGYRGNPIEYEFGKFSQRHHD